MIYQHKYFVLDTKSKKVFDENSKELRLTGNAYRVFAFLCEKNNADITDINTCLDWAKEYNENHIRQYRYKINTIIGHDVVEYKNNIYSLIGELKTADKKDKKLRNTDLLQGNSVRLEKSIMSELKNIKFSIVPAIVASILLLLTFLDWQYGYYNFLRIVVTAVAIYYAYYLYQKFQELNLWFWGLAIIIILFNPIFPIYLGDKSVWIIIDIITAIFFTSLIIRFKKIL